MLKSLIPDEVKVNVTIDDIRLKSNLKFYQTSVFTKRSSFTIFLGVYSITFFFFRRYRWSLSIDCAIIYKHLLILWVLIKKV